jgi:hypothetical protein
MNSALEAISDLLFFLGIEKLSVKIDKIVEKRKKAKDAEANH